jgi:two-component system NarL family sensor kinase
MSNAVRHGLADHAVIRVHCTGYSVVLEVIDNGRGFEDKKPEQMGLGMRSMQDRLSMVDGKLTVTSQPGRTCIRVEIPGILPEDKSPSV